MIIDRIENINLYENLSPLFQKAFEYLKNTDFSTKPLGKEVIEGEKLFAILMEYETGTHIEIEAHKKYIDIQFIVEGEEVMMLHTKNGQEKIIKPYSEKEDYAVYETPTSNYLFTKNMVAIFFPDDLHSPCMLANNQVSKVRKVVLKVQL